MTYVEPVMYAAASDARNTHSAATSWGLPMRRNGISSSSAFILVLSASSGASIGVSIAPGATLFTVMPCGASSTAMVRMSIRRPPLAAQYGLFVGIGRSSWTDDTLMMRPPPPCATICLAARWLHKNGSVRLTAMTLSHSDFGVSRNGNSCSMPALLTMATLSCSLISIDARYIFRERQCKAPVHRDAYFSVHAG